MRAALIGFMAVGCAGSGGYCEDKVDCEGGIDLAVTACDADVSDTRTRAENLGCLAEYEAHQSCVQSESSCDSGSFGPGAACDETEDALEFCLDPYLTTDPNNTGTTPDEPVDLETAQGWVGTQIYTRGQSDQPGVVQCELHFDTLGTRLIPTPVECADCLWAFEVDMTLNPALGFDEGICAAQGLDQQTEALYGVRDDGQPDSVWLVRNRDNNFFDFGLMRQTGQATISFDGGPIDELSQGNYQTDHWEGTATLNK